MIGAISVAAILFILQTATKMDMTLQTLVRDKAEASAPHTFSAWKSLENSNSHLHSELDLPSIFHICPYHTPEYGHPKFTFESGLSPIEKKLLLEVRYQCAGNSYEHYMRHIQYPYALKRHEEDPSLKWGKRPAILPPLTPISASDGDTRKILMIGNSHTRQLAISLLCMYFDDVEDVKKIEIHENEDENLWQFTLKGDTTITLFANHPAVYSHRWQKNLEEYLTHKLSDLDAVILGMFNEDHAGIVDADQFRDNHPELEIEYDDDDDFYDGYHDKYIDNETHHIRALSNSKQTFTNHERGGAHVGAWLDAYDGPILYTAHPLRMTEEALEKVLNARCTDDDTIDANSNCNDNRRWIDETKHVPAMNYATCNRQGGRVETVGTCIDDKENDEYFSGHNCRGFLGGYSDLTAWDVVEALWEVL